MVALEPRGRVLRRGEGLGWSFPVPSALCLLDTDGSPSAPPSTPARLLGWPPAAFGPGLVCGCPTW